MREATLQPLWALKSIFPACESSISLEHLGSFVVSKDKYRIPLVMRIFFYEGLVLSFRKLASNASSTYFLRIRSSRE
jgi:hypothetical protein